MLTEVVLYIKKKFVLPLLYWLTLKYNLKKVSFYFLRMWSEAHLEIQKLHNLIEFCI